MLSILPTKIKYMKFNSDDSPYILGFALVLITFIIVVVLALMQTKIEKMQFQIDAIQHDMDSIHLINSYDYHHSEIKQ